MSDTTENGNDKVRAGGYHTGDVETVISVDDVTRQVAEIAEKVTLEDIAALANNDPFVTIENLRAGYGKMEILHDFEDRRMPVRLVHSEGRRAAAKVRTFIDFTARLLRHETDLLAGG